MLFLSFVSFAMIDIKKKQLRGKWLAIFSIGIFEVIFLWLFHS